MLDHVAIAVSSIDRSRAFYDRALSPIGVTVLWVAEPDEVAGTGTAIGYGSGGRPYFWIGDSGSAGAGTHVAFRVRTRVEVDAFHAAAMAAGGRDNGAPGLRPHYHPDYYSAFVLDPDGVNVEAVCHAPG